MSKTITLDLLTRIDTKLSAIDLGITAIKSAVITRETLLWAIGEKLCERVIALPANNYVKLTMHATQAFEPTLWESIKIFLGKEPKRKTRYLNLIKERDSAVILDANVQLAEGMALHHQNAYLLIKSEICKYRNSVYFNTQEQGENTHDAFLGYHLSASLNKADGTVSFEGDVRSYLSFTLRSNNIANDRMLNELTRLREHLLDAKKLVNASERKAKSVNRSQLLEAALEGLNEELKTIVPDTKVQGTKLQSWLISLNEQ